jgi:predicted metalloprotease with PDZ domain
MWQAEYWVKILRPSTHYVQVSCKIQTSEMPNQLEIFLPAWSPGSYLMREYAKNLRRLKVCNQSGEELEVQPQSKSSWLVLTRGSKQEKCDYITVEYEVYCHELSVRTSYVDDHHAFLHGPTYLIGFMAKGSEQTSPVVEFDIPKQWSKISTVLKPVPNLPREILRYQAAHYDELWDCPVELGCHETDGFRLNNTNYFLAIFGSEFPHKNTFKADIIKITETINSYWGEIPFDEYLYLIHFLPNNYGGLEHANSTVLMFDGRKLAIRKEYLSFLSLVAHEYFHAWNVKRIRPKELGPFDYQNENYTSMLWLAEGLTKFMDDYLVLYSGLMNIEEYCDFLKSDMNTYFKTAGRKYDSLENSSWGAWIKLYRPHENSINSSISYYLKGGLVFLCLQMELKNKGLSLKTFNHQLWMRYKNNPNSGITKEEFYSLLETFAGEDILDFFDDYISTTKEINFLKHFSQAGIEIVWEKEKLDLGLDIEYQGDRIIIKTVLEDGGAFQSGLNAQDEILAVNNTRLLKSDWDWFMGQLQENIYYDFTVSRLGMIVQCEVLAKKSFPKVSALKVTDVQKFKNVFELG